MQFALIAVNSLFFIDLFKNFSILELILIDDILFLFVLFIRKTMSLLMKMRIYILYRFVVSVVINDMQIIIVQFCVHIQYFEILIMRSDVPFFKL